MPVWKYTIKLGDVFHNENLTFEQRRDKIVKRLKDSAWVKAQDELSPIHEYLEELAEVENADDFDVVWDAIYDEADATLAWIQTW